MSAIGALMIFFGIYAAGAGGGDPFLTGGGVALAAAGAYVMTSA